jgi:hypothetical protein
MSETIQVACQHCRQPFRVRTEHLNRQARCPHCKQVTVLQVAGGAAAMEDLLGAIPPVHAPQKPAPKPARANEAAALGDLLGAIAPAHSSQKAAHKPAHAAGHKAGHKVGHKAGHKPQSQGDEDPTQKPQMAVTGVRSKNVAIIWMSILGVALVAGLILAVVAVNRSGCQGPASPKEKQEALAAKAKQTAAQNPVAGVPPKTLPAVGTPATGAEGTGEGEAAAAAQPPEKTGTGASAAVGGQVVIDAKRITGGEIDSLSYVLGRVTNQTGSLIPRLKVDIPVKPEGGAGVGHATAVILNIPAGASAPLVAAWTHEADVRGTLDREGIKYTVDATPGFQPILVEDASFTEDASSMTKGRVNAFLTNKGFTALTEVEMFAILLDEQGKIIGMAADSVQFPAGVKMLKPNSPVRCTIQWARCPSHLVRSVEVWAQPSLR